MVPTVKLDKLHLVAKLSEEDIKDVLASIRFEKSNQHYYYVLFINDSSKCCIFLKPTRTSTYKHYNCFITFNPANMSELPPQAVYVLQKTRYWKIKRMDVALDFDIAVSNTFLVPYRNMRQRMIHNNYNFYRGTEKSRVGAIVYDKAREMREKGSPLNVKHLTRIELRFKPKLSEQRFITASDFSWTEPLFSKFVIIPDIRKTSTKAKNLIKDINYKKKKYANLKTTEKNSVKEAAKLHGVNYYPLFSSVIAGLLYFLPDCIRHRHGEQLTDHAS